MLSEETLTALTMERILLKSWDAGEVELEFSGAEPSERSTTRFKFVQEAGAGQCKTRFVNKFRS